MADDSRTSTFEEAKRKSEKKEMKNQMFERNFMLVIIGSVRMGEKKEMKNQMFERNFMLVISGSVRMDVELARKNEYTSRGHGNDICI
jgi:hypothetical protein